MYCFLQQQKTAKIHKTQSKFAKLYQNTANINFKFKNICNIYILYMFLISFDWACGTGGKCKGPGLGIRKSCGESQQK